jgi:hypothetical protein
VAEVWVEGSAGLALIRTESISSVNLRSGGATTFVDVMSEGESYAIAKKTIEGQSRLTPEIVVKEAGPIRAEFLQLLHELELSESSTPIVLVHGETGWKYSKP